MTKEEKKENPEIPRRSSNFQSWAYDKKSGQIRITFHIDALGYLIEDLQAIHKEVKTNHPDLNGVTIVFVEDRGQKAIS